jgi:type IV secretion system protein VirB8
VGAAGAVIGVLGVATAAAVAVSHAPTVRYTEIDDASGVIRESFGAQDAPSHFNERVLRHYIAEYIELRERFVWQLDPETDHRVKLMSSPDEQRRYASDRSKSDPAGRYGMHGYARVTKFVSFTPRGKGRDGTLEYDVQFVKSEVLAADLSRVVTTRQTARIGFQMHPELPMNDQDRLNNESGMMTVVYNASPD